jgi:hypothetical protein
VDDATWIASFVQHWPTLAWLVPVVMLGYYALRFLALANDPVARLLGGLGRHWQKSAERKQKHAAGELGLLKAEVQSLSERVDRLQKRDEIYWAYVMADEAFHRQDDFARVQAGQSPSGHLSFLQFRAQRLKDRSKHDDFEDEDNSW